MPTCSKPLALRAYLRMSASSCTVPGGPRGLVVFVGDTEGLFPDGLRAQWLGEEAAAFLDTHKAELVKGRCLDLEVYHLRPVNNELRARIKTCQLAPLAPSWLKHAESHAEKLSTTESHAQ